MTEQNLKCQNFKTSKPVIILWFKNLSHEKRSLNDHHLSFRDPFFKDLLLFLLLYVDKIIYRERFTL